MQQKNKFYVPVSTTIDSSLIWLLFFMIVTVVIRDSK